MSNQFKDACSLTIWVKNFLYLQILVAVIALVSGFLEFQLLNDFRSGFYPSQEQAVIAGEASDQRQLVVAVIQMLTLLVSGIMILKWIYRANYNARQLGGQGMQYTPGWSVGWYFVPILSLWKPFQAMQEIWQVSRNPQDWLNVSTPAFLRWWWFWFVTSSLLGNISFRMAKDAEELDEFIHANVASMLSDLVAIPLALVTLLVVRRVYAAQIATYENQSAEHAERTEPATEEK